MASQPYALAGAPSTVGAAVRGEHARVRKMAKMGSALLRGVERDLRGRHIESYPARSGHLVWHHDLVAARMVAPRLGPHLHRGFHTDRDFPCAAIIGVGLCLVRKRESTSRRDVAGVPAGAISHRQNW